MRRWRTDASSSTAHAPRFLHAGQSTATAQTAPAPARAVLRAPTAVAGCALASQRASLSAPPYAASPVSTPRPYSQHWRKRPCVSASAPQPHSCCGREGASAHRAVARLERVASAARQRRARGGARDLVR
jgi:hypothetical protein